MQQRLALTRAAEDIARLAIFSHLRDVAGDLLPPRYLAAIVRYPPPAVITAVPLKPAARIVGMNPAFAAPHRQGLAGIDAEKIELWILSIPRQFGTLEPVSGKFGFTVRQVFPAENAQRQHLPRGKVRRKTGGEVLSWRFGKPVAVIALHPVVDDDECLFGHGSFRISVALTQDYV